MFTKGQEEKNKNGVSRALSYQDKLVMSRVQVRNACKLILNNAYLNSIHEALVKEKQNNELTETPTSSLFNKVKNGLISLSGVLSRSHTPFKHVIAKNGKYNLSIPLANDIEPVDIHNLVKLVSSMLSDGIRKNVEVCKNLMFNAAYDTNKSNIAIEFMLVK